MPSSRILRGVAEGIAGSFISRNNDVNGYWAIGKLLSHAVSQKSDCILLDLVGGQLTPDHSQFHGMAHAYATMLQKQLGRNHLPPDRVRRAGLRVTFDSNLPLFAIPRATHRCVCKVEIEDWRGKKHIAEQTTSCARHSVLHEIRSTRANILRANSVRTPASFQIVFQAGLVASAIFVGIAVCMGMDTFRAWQSNSPLSNWKGGTMPYKYGALLTLAFGSLAAGGAYFSLKGIKDRIIQDLSVRDTDVRKPITDADLSKLEDPKYGIITIDENGVQVKHPKLVASTAWCDVREVFAYKRDLLTTDLICLALCTSNNAPVLETHEEMQGFVKLWRELERRLPGFQEKYTKWLLSSPAFDSQPTSIWKRAT